MEMDTDGDVTPVDASVKRDKSPVPRRTGKGHDDGKDDDDFRDARDDNPVLEAETPESQTSHNACPHIKAAVNLQGIRKSLKSWSGSLCDVEASKQETDGRVTSKEMWLCLQCGHFGAGDNRAQQGDAEEHFKATTPQHNLVWRMGVESSDAYWCYSCQTLVDAADSYLKDFIQFTKRHPKLKAYVQQSKNKAAAFSSDGGSNDAVPTSTTVEGKTDDVGMEVDDTVATGKAGDNDKLQNATDGSPVTVKTEKVDADDDDVMVVNPLYGKEKKGKDIPLYDISSSSSSDSEDDYSEDVHVTNFLDDIGGGGSEGAAAAWSGSGTGQLHPQGSNCGCGCYEEKGILVNEIERLRKAVFELSERHSVLEDFVEVEFGSSFEKYMKQRDHLVSMGFGSGETSSGEVTGKRSSKSSELVELLKMIREQAASNEDAKSTTSTSSQNKGTSPGDSQKSSTASQNKSPKSNPRQQSNTNKPQHSKPIPSIANRGFNANSQAGRSGAMDYNQRQATGFPQQQHYQALMQKPAELLARNPASVGFQFQQQHLMMAPPSNQHAARTQAAQAAFYYANAQRANSAYQSNNRDYITAVGRNDVLSNIPYGYGFNSRNVGPSGGGYAVPRVPLNKHVGEGKESKKQRKRKRKSEASETASNSTASTTASTTKSTPGGEGGDLNPSSKRICPLCSKILSKKGFRDHLIVHQGINITCPVANCSTECFLRRRLKLHLRDDHSLPENEYTLYLNKMSEAIQRQIGPVVDKLLQEAKPPTKQQLLDYNMAIQVAMASQRPEGDGNEGGEGGKSVSTGSRPSTSSAKQTSAAGKGNSVQQKSQKQQQQQARMNNDDLYGPGGYAQYAARYLQERSAAPASRLYTPF